MEAFDVLNMGIISNFYLDHSNRFFFSLFKFQEPRVLTQKLVLKNMHRVLRYCQKGMKFLTFCWKAKFGYIFANIP